MAGGAMAEGRHGRGLWGREAAGPCAGRRRGVVQTGQHLVTITDPAALRQIAAAGR